MSAADELAEFYVHTVTIRPVTGGGAYGTVYGAPFDLACFVDEQTRLVRDDDGAEVVSTATIHAAPNAAAPTGSEVTLPSGKTARVLTTAHRDSGDLDLPDHVEILVG